MTMMMIITMLMWLLAIERKKKKYLGDHKQVNVLHQAKDGTCC